MWRSKRQSRAIQVCSTEITQLWFPRAYSGKSLESRISSFNGYSVGLAALELPRIPLGVWIPRFLCLPRKHHILSMIQKKTQNQDSRFPVQCGCCTPAVTQHSTAEHHCLWAWPHFTLTPDMASYTTARWCKINKEKFNNSSSELLNAHESVTKIKLNKMI